MLIFQSNDGWMQSCLVIGLKSDKMMVLIGILLTFWGTKTMWAEFRQITTHSVKHWSSWLPILPKFGRRVSISCGSRSCGSSPLWAEKTMVVPMAIDATTANKIVIRMQWYFLLRLRNRWQHDVFSDVWSSRFKEISALNCKDSACALATIGSIGSIVSSKKK